MESSSDRVLRQRNAVQYFPKPQLYNLVVEERSNNRARRRSKSVEKRQAPEAAARRTIRSKSVDQRVAVRRSDTIVALPDTNNYLVQANAMLAKELIRMKGEIDTQHKKIDSLIKQNMANKKIIEYMRNDCNEKDAELAHVKKALETAINSLDTNEYTTDSFVNDGPFGNLSDVEINDKIDSVGHHADSHVDPEYVEEDELEEEWLEEEALNRLQGAFNALEINESTASSLIDNPLDVLCDASDERNLQIGVHGYHVNSDTDPEYIEEENVESDAGQENFDWSWFNEYFI